MKIKSPSERIITAVESAIKWFEITKIEGLREERTYTKEGKLTGKKMISDVQAAPVWARFMELEDNTPFFCDRDGLKKGAISEIGLERRNGYKWYSTEPNLILDAYATWSKKNGYNSKELATYTTIVAQDGTGDYTTIQKAIDQTKSFPDEQITIFIKNGVYKEKVKVHEWNSNLLIVGESKDHTIIIYDDYFNKMGLGRNSTFHTYTFLVEAHHVTLKNLTIENSSGNVGQAVALSVFSDQVAVVNCKLLGNQDTLYASGKGRQYYKDCYIEGTTDFIFGSAAAFFENCTIHSKKDSYITAASTHQDSEYGFVFKGCTLTSKEGLSNVYLGRPWRKYAQTVFVHCKLGKHITLAGWHNWSKPDAERTTYYAEYGNEGIGASTSLRVKWSYQLSGSEVQKYTREKVLGSYCKTSKKAWYEKI